MLRSRSRIAGDFDAVHLQAGIGTNAVLSAGVGGAIGTGGFGSKVSYSVGGSAAAIATGDLNGDGFLDIANADFGSDTMSILLSLGNGSFAPRAR
jgi:hypothetical protein